MIWPNDADKDGAFLNQVLLEASKTLENEENIVIAIDALDEVDLSDMPHRANVLYLPPTLPPGVFIIATTRRKYDLHLNVTNFEVFDIEANSEANKRDARIYIEYRLDKEMMDRILEWNISVEQCVDTLLEKSETNFMYLRHVMPAVKKGQFKEGRLDELPKGLIAYYRSHWNQMRKINSEKFDQHYQPIICVLAAVEEAVTANQISNFTGIDSVIIQDVIREWFEFLSHEFSENREPIYRLYHTAFKEFLQQEVDPGLKKYHRMIADYYL